MNPQPVSLAEGLQCEMNAIDGLVRVMRLSTHPEKSAREQLGLAANLLEEIRSELSALLEQHAVAEPRKGLLSEPVQAFIRSNKGVSLDLSSYQGDDDLPAPAHAAEQPKLLTEELVREAWNAIPGEEPSMKTYYFKEFAEKLNNLLTSPVAPPPQKVKRPELRHPPVAINCRCDGNKVSALIGPNLMEGVAGFGDNLPEALRDLADELYREVGEPPVAPGEQPPQVEVCGMCGGFLQGDYCSSCDVHVVDEDARNSIAPSPPAQERASDEALEDLPQIHYVATRGEPEPSGYYVPIKEAKKLLATAAKQAREEVLEEAAKHRPVYDDNGDPDSCVACDWKPSSWTREIKWDPTGEWERHIRAIAAQPSPQTKEDGK